jgi:hypothetical protein
MKGAVCARKAWRASGRATALQRSTSSLRHSFASISASSSGSPAPPAPPPPPPPTLTLPSSAAAVAAIRARARARGPLGLPVMAPRMAENTCRLVWCR